ncbi:hypothetical protein Tco_1293181 [Tanacetum coccineum]
MSAFKVLQTQFQMFIKSRFYLDDEYVDMTRNKFLQYTRLDILEFRNTLIQHMESVKKSIGERAQHKMEYESRVNERQIQTKEEKTDTSNALDALDASLVIIESNGQTSKGSRIHSSRSRRMMHMYMYNPTEEDVHSLVCEKERYPQKTGLQEFLDLMITLMITPEFTTTAMNTSSQDSLVSKSCSLKQQDSYITTTDAAITYTSHLSHRAMQQDNTRHTEPRSQSLKEQVTTKEQRQRPRTLELKRQSNLTASHEGSIINEHTSVGDIDVGKVGGGRSGESSIPGEVVEAKQDLHPGICIEVESMRFLATHSPVIDTLLPFSSENKDKVFNHSVLASKEKSHPFSSHRALKLPSLFI